MLAYLYITPVASLIFICTILVSIWAWKDSRVFESCLFHPYSIWRNKNYHTLITSGLIHRDGMHLFFNLFSFYFFAFQLEQIVGHWQFAVIYFGGMVLADSSTLYKYRDAYLYRSLGASGAISAVVFSYILFNPMARMMIFPIPIPIPAVIFGGLYLAYCAYASKRNADYINHDAHFLGAIAGLMITVLLFPKVLPFFIGQLI